MMPSPDFFLEYCPFSKGDTVSTVKEFYEISFDPLKLTQPFASGTHYQYHFEEYGVWLFFDANQRLQTLRFDAPFAGKIAGFGVGDYKEDIQRLKGAPARQMTGFPDDDALKDREQQKQALLEALPDPVPKEIVMEAFSAIAQLNRLPIPSTSSWIYDLEKPGYVRYDISPTSGKVQNIFASIGTERVIRPTFSQDFALIRRAYREAGHVFAWYDCYQRLRSDIDTDDKAPEEIEELIAIALPPFKEATIDSENPGWKITTSSLASLNNAAYVLLGGYAAEQLRFGRTDDKKPSKLLDEIDILHSRYFDELSGDLDLTYSQERGDLWEQNWTVIKNNLNQCWSAVEKLATTLLETRTLTKLEALRIIEQSELL